MHRLRGHELKKGPFIGAQHCLGDTLLKCDRAVPKQGQTHGANARELAILHVDGNPAVCQAEVVEVRHERVPPRLVGKEGWPERIRQR